MSIVTSSTFPLLTFNGIKYRATVPKPKRGRWTSCDKCPYREGCTEDVLRRDGFAWCEELLPVDLDPGYVEPREERRPSRQRYA